MAIACDDCKVYLWIGQRSSEKEDTSRWSFYSGQPETMEQLKLFLFKHQYFWRRLGMPPTEEGEHHLRFAPSDTFFDLEYRDVEEEIPT